MLLIFLIHLSLTVFIVLILLFCLFVLSHYLPSIPNVSLECCIQYNNNKMQEILLHNQVITDKRKAEKKLNIFQYGIVCLSVFVFVCFRWSPLCRGSPTTALHKSKASGMCVVFNSHLSFEQPKHSRVSVKPFGWMYSTFARGPALRWRWLLTSGAHLQVNLYF